MTIKEMIAVMQAADEGKTIQIKKFGWGDLWDDCCDNEPEWDWKNNEYRVKPETNTRPMTFEEIVDYWKEHRTEIIKIYFEDKNGKSYKTEGIIYAVDYKHISFAVGLNFYVPYKNFIKNSFKEDGSRFEVEL